VLLRGEEVPAKHVLAEGIKTATSPHEEKIKNGSGSVAS